MIGLVLDCSIAVAWVFADEATPEIDRLRELVRREGAVVPALWWFELGNVLLKAERRGRVTPDDGVQHLRFMATLPIIVDAVPVQDALSDIVVLARAHALTAYDAAYLELAMRRGMPLATKDAALSAAAKKMNVTVLPEPDHQALAQGAN